MKPSCREFASILVDQSAGLRATHQETLEYWAPDEPPDTILFAELGRRVVEDLGEAGIEANQRIFQLIETAMVSDDDELRTAVATGLIEAVVTKTDGDERLWRYVSSMFGEVSRKHAEAWRAWGTGGHA